MLKKMLERRIIIDDSIFTVVMDGNYSGLDNNVAKLHNHSMFEVYFVRAGVYSHKTGNMAVSIHPGEYCIIRPMAYHCKEASADGIAGLTIKFSCDTRTNEMIDTLLLNAKDCHIGRISETLGFALDHILAEFHENGWGETERLISFFVLVFTEIFGNIFRPKDRGGEESRSAEDDLSLKIDEFFGSNYMLGITVADLAKRLHISERHVNRVLKRKYGQSFKRKLTDMRMNAAKERLVSTSLSVTNISHAVGYANSIHFAKVFKESTGYTPNQFRKRFNLRTGARALPIL